MELEGELIIEYEGCCDDIINILLKNGYTLTIDLNEENQLKIIYYKYMKGEK